MFDYLRNFSKSGTIMSSSEQSINGLLDKHSVRKCRSIIELGGGTGRITRKILDCMHENAVLYCFEIQPHLQRTLMKIDDSRIQIVKDSAFNIRRHHDKNSIDLIISTLPLSFFSKEQRYGLMKDCYETLSAGGQFRQLSFLFFPGYFTGIFDDVSTRWRVIDMPPSIAYYCQKAPSYARKEQLSALQ